MKHNRKFFIWVSVDGIATYSEDDNEAEVMQSFENAFEKGKARALKFIGDYKAEQAIIKRKEIDNAQRSDGLDGGDKKDTSRTVQE